MTTMVFAVTAYKGVLNMGLISQDEKNRLVNSDFSTVYAEEFISAYNDHIDGYTSGAVYFPQNEQDVESLSDETIYRSLSIDSKNKILTAYREFLSENPQNA